MQNLAVCSKVYIVLKKNIRTCLCASVAYDFLKGFNSVEANPGIHILKLRSIKRLIKKYKLISGKLIKLY